MNPADPSPPAAPCCFSIFRFLIPVSWIFSRHIVTLQYLFDLLQGYGAQTYSQIHLYIVVIIHNIINSISYFVVFSYRLCTRSQLLYNQHIHTSYNFPDHNFTVPISHFDTELSRKPIISNLEPHALPLGHCLPVYLLMVSIVINNIIIVGIVHLGNSNYRDQ